MHVHMIYNKLIISEIDADALLASDGVVGNSCSKNARF